MKREFEILRRVEERCDRYHGKERIEYLKERYRDDIMKPL